MFGTRADHCTGSFRDDAAAKTVTVGCDSHSVFETVEQRHNIQQSLVITVLIKIFNEYKIPCFRGVNPFRLINPSFQILDDGVPDSQNYMRIAYNHGKIADFCLESAAASPVSGDDQNVRMDVYVFICLLRLFLEHLVQFFLNLRGNFRFCLSHGHFFFSVVIQPCINLVCREKQRTECHSED